MVGLIIVDYQNDFLPGGALGVTDGHRAYPEIDRQAKIADVIILTRDWHPADHISFSNDPKYEDKSWPAHCVQNTYGAKFDKIMIERLDKTKPFYVASKGEMPNLEEYSGLYGRIDEDTIAVDILQARRVQKVTIVGLALDYCVRATALDAIKERFDVTLPVEGTRPVTYETGARTIAELVDAGVRVV